VKPETRLSTLDDDGWTLEDAEDRYQRGEDLYWLPPRWEREHLEDHLEARVYAKLIFLIRFRTHEGREDVRGERMWVNVAAREGEYYHGHLANEPHTTAGSAHEGMAVWFRPEHVIDLIVGEGEPASRSASTLQCSSHGISERCYVCEHLVGAAEQGFHTADDPEANRPDAWCDECERVLDQFGSWEDAGDLQPKLSILCGGCYDAARERNQRRGA
jgi:hypothetical protein